MDESAFPVGSYPVNTTETGFPKDYGYSTSVNYNDELDDTVDCKRPKILLMGLRRSGKSSIKSVVFYKMAPNETLFLETTTKTVKDDVSHSSFVQFQIWDCPGQIDFTAPQFDKETLFSDCGALIFVIDSQDDYTDALRKLNSAVWSAYSVNKDIKFEVFIHKVDGLSDDHKIETQRAIHQQASDDLLESNLNEVQLSFYLTSIYDHSIFEAFSKVVQKLIPQLEALENLLDLFVSNSVVDKAFLFDVLSKIYIAADSSAVDMQSYELCCDMIDVVIDVSCIYGLKDEQENTAFDGSSASIIRLNNSTVLYLREINKFLALVCILKDNAFSNQGIIDYNFNCLREAIHSVFNINSSMSQNSMNHVSNSPDEKDDGNSDSESLNSKQLKLNGLGAGAGAGTGVNGKNAPTSPTSYLSTA